MIRVLVKRERFDVYVCRGAARWSSSSTQDQALRFDDRQHAQQRRVDAIGTSLDVPRMGATRLTFFGGLALLVASPGVDGVLAFSIARRRREIGIRVALGADHRCVSGLILREGMSLVAVGRPSARLRSLPVEVVELVPDAAFLRAFPDVAARPGGTQSNPPDGASIHLLLLLGHRGRRDDGRRC